MKQLDIVLKGLKTGKSEDPSGWTNELFMHSNIGNDLKESVLLLINRVKDDLDNPEFMNQANITSLWKNKGSKSDLNNDRGIFLLNLIRMIKDKMILNDIKPIIFNFLKHQRSRQEKNHRINPLTLRFCSKLNFALKLKE